MSEFSAQRLLVAIMVLIFLAGVAFTVRAKTRGHKWLGLFFLIACSENVISFPAAVLGFEPYQWMLGNPDATRYLWIVLVAMSSMGIAILILAPRMPLPGFLDNLPALRLRERDVRSSLWILSAMTALLALILSANGYYGYYLNRTYLDNPPAWIDLVRALIKVGRALSFLFFLDAFATHKRLGTAGWLLAMLWVASGTAAGYKTFIVLPFFFIGLAAWLQNKLRPAHLAVFGISFVAAYSVIGPLRELRFRSGHDNALEGIRVLYANRDVAVASPTFVIEATLRRLDNTVSALQALEADRYGRTDRYRSRLRQMYSVLPLLPFVPAAIWPDKPKANLGRELSIAVTGNPENSITPSTAVASWFWLGWFGVIVNSIIRACFLVLATRLVEKYLHRPLAYAPVVVLVLAFSVHNWLVATHIVSAVRTVILVLGFYLVARSAALVYRQPSPIGS